MFYKGNLIVFLFITVSSLLVGVLSYKQGIHDGCYKVIQKENDYGVNNSKTGIGLDAYSWCERNDK